MSTHLKSARWLLLVAILLVAIFLRTYRLQELPRGPYYDEAANGVLASEIATGQAFPLFIRSYTGKEVLYFYAVAATMKVLGIRLLSMRLTSAVMGVATVALTYWLGLQLFDDEDEQTRQCIAWSAAALAAVNFWHIVISRYGFRAISQPLLQALALGFIWRGLRRGGWRDLTLAGIFTGLTAYTYLASRIVPIALLPLVGGLWLTGKPVRALIGKRILIFGLVAAVVLAPLGIFFLQNPETFGTRMGQVSVLNPELNQGDPWGALLRSIGAAFAMFTLRGDPQSRFGVIGRPVFDPVVGVFFYLGVGVSLFRIVRGPKGRDRVRYLSLLTWVPLLLVPSILGVREVPHSLRAIGVMPVLFFFPAIGFGTALRWLSQRFQRLQFLAHPAVPLILAAVLLVEGGIPAGWDYFAVWGTDSVPYYENDNDLADAARTLNEIDTEGYDIYFSAMHYRHPTAAFLADDYYRIHWLVDGLVVPLPAPESKGAVYVFPRSAMPDRSLLDMLGTVTEEQRYLGPDGETAYLVFQVEQDHVPEIAPQTLAGINFGHQIELLGYDLPPTVAGEPLVATLYWRVLAPPKATDYMLFAHLADPWDLQWAASDAFDYPSEDWIPGQVLVQRREVPVPPLTPPGEYELLVGYVSHGQNARLPRLDAQGRVAGTTAALGPVSIAPAAEPPDTFQVQVSREASFDNLSLLGFRRDQTSVRPGERYYLGLYWRADGPLPDMEVILNLQPKGGEKPWSLYRARPLHDTWPTDQWPTGTTVLDQYALTVPHDAPARDYAVTLSLRDLDNGAMAGDPVPLTDLDVQQVDRRTIVPPMQHTRQVNMGGRVELLGYDLSSTESQPGETIELTLYWRALSEMETSYTVFTHLLDGANQIRGQHDNPPVNGTYPTTLWVPGEIVTDPYRLTVDADAAPGTHAIEVGLYVVETGQRLPVLDEGGQVQGDRILISEIEVQ